MQLSREQVQHIAELAKLELTEEETKVFAKQLSEVLDYAQALNELDTESISPTAQAIYARNVTRSDEPGTSLDPEEALGNAPQRDGNYFKVKPILDTD